MSKQNCNIFSYNAKLQTCQMSACENDKHLDDLSESNGWNTYFLTINTQKNVSDLFDKIRETKLFEVLTFHEEALTKDTEMDVDVNSVYLTICFWFKMNKYNEKKCKKKGHANVCSDDEGKGFENGYLFDFNIFNRKLDESEVRLVRTGKSQITSAVSWDDVRCNFVNVLNPILQMRSINMHQKIKKAIV